MSLQCSFYNCGSAAEWECTQCSGLRMCANHLKIHLKTCEETPVLLSEKRLQFENKSSNQKEKATKAHIFLDQLHAKIIERSEKMIEIIKESCSGALFSLEKKREIILAFESGLGNKKIEVEFEKLIELSMVELNVFAESSREFFELKEKKSNEARNEERRIGNANTQARVEEIKREENQRRVGNVVSASLDNITSSDKSEFFKKIHIDLPRQVMKKKFSQDRKTAFICKIYLDRKEHLGTRY